MNANNLVLTRADTYLFKLAKMIANLCIRHPEFTVGMEVSSLKCVGVIAVMP